MSKKVSFSATHDALTFLLKNLREKKKSRTCSSSVTRLSIVPLFFVLFEKVKTGGVAEIFAFEC